MPNNSQRQAATARSVATIFGAILLSACSMETLEDPFASDVESVDEGSGALSNATYWCPSGSSFDPTYRLCTTAKEALGPFTPAMIKACKAHGGGDSACEKPWWNTHFAKSIRGTGRCLPGSTLDTKKGYCTDSANVYGPFSFALVDRCRRNQGGPACETTRWGKAMVPDRPNVWCPDGTDYDFEHQLCISEKEAVGPFTSSMIDTCIKAGGGSQACRGDRWDLAFARWARGTGSCPKGASFDAKKGYCAEGDNLFGPFSPTLVSQCRTKGGGLACEAMRWKRAMVPDTATATTPSSVPYYYQYNNAYEPGATCGLTSGAMLLRRWGKNVTPDSLYLSHGKGQGQSPGNLANLYRAHGLSATSSYTASESTIKSHLDAGRPVVVHGYFTGSGHIVVLVGYDATGWVVNDPAGKWAGCVGCGYPTRTSTNGRGVHYSYTSVRAAIGSSGNIWMSTAY